MLQILLCDDDGDFLNTLRDKIRSILLARQLPCAITCYQDPGEITPQAARSTDLLFLDIDFAGKSFNGLDVARRLREYAPHSVLIFVTSYVQYAPEGYEMQAFRYLLKNELDSKLPDYLLQATNKLERTQRRISVTINGEPTTLLLSDILYLQSQGHTVHIHTTGQIHSVYGTISQWEEKLQELGFLRTQKSYLVNMQHIKTYQCDSLALKNGTSLPVSEKFYGEKKKQFLLWKGRH